MSPCLPSLPDSSLSGTDGHQSRRGRRRESRGLPSSLPSYMSREVSHRTQAASAGQESLPLILLEQSHPSGSFLHRGRNKGSGMQHVRPDDAPGHCPPLSYPSFCLPGEATCPSDIAQTGRGALEAPSPSRLGPEPHAGRPWTLSAKSGRATGSPSRAEAVGPSHTGSGTRSCARPEAPVGGGHSPPGIKDSPEIRTSRGGGKGKAGVQGSPEGKSWGVITLISKER